MSKSQRTAAAERIQKWCDTDAEFDFNDWIQAANTNINELLTLRADAERENDELREYANHLYKCRMNNMRRSPFKCTCKLDELLNQQEKDND